jgi:hypothetical protein
MTRSLSIFTFVIAALCTVLVLAPAKSAAQSAPPMADHPRGGGPQNMPTPAPNLPGVYEPPSPSSLFPPGLFGLFGLPNSVGGSGPSNSSSPQQASPFLAVPSCYSAAASAEANLQCYLFPNGVPSLSSTAADGLFGPLESMASTINATVGQWADELFIALVVLELTYSVAYNLLNSSTDLPHMFGSLCTKVIIYNAAYWVFVRNGFAIAVLIVTSFSSIGTNLMGSIYASQQQYNQGQYDPNTGIQVTNGLSAAQPPSDPIGVLALGFATALPDFVVAQGLSLVPDEVLGTGVTEAANASVQAGILGGFITLSAYAFMAGTLAIVLVEAYIVLSVGIIVTGFLGSRWTQQIGQNYFSYAVTVGVKLMMVYVCLAIVNPLSPEIAALGAVPLVGGAASAALAFMLGMVCWNAPNFAASILMGTSRVNFSNYMASASSMLFGAGVLAMNKPYAWGRGRQRPINSFPDFAQRAFYKLKGTPYQEWAPPQRATPVGTPQTQRPALQRSQSAPAALGGGVDSASPQALQRSDSAEFNGSAFPDSNAAQPIDTTQAGPSATPPPREAFRAPIAYPAAFTPPGVWAKELRKVLQEELSGDVTNGPRDKSYQKFGMPLFEASRVFGNVAAKDNSDSGVTDSSSIPINLRAGN